MLVLMREVGERLVIDDALVVEVLEAQGALQAFAATGRIHAGDVERLLLETYPCSSTGASC
jgi:hypothetical protein